MENPQRPLVAIVGGAKVSSKLVALENMLQHVDKVLIGGAMANTFLKSMGCDVGNSKVEEDLIEVAASIMNTASQKGIQFYLPVDVVIAPEANSNVETRVVAVREIPPGWMALDIGPATSLLFSEVLTDAKTIVWNGPLGLFEIEAFNKGTLFMVSRVANSGALTIIGGGDTDAAVHMTGDSEKISFISTGGGAFLSLLEGKTLPAVAALDAAESQTNNPI
jgi:phosphoglycerate kinase